ncbi:MAG: hypothetical protein AAF720_04440 [Pseudomonadota bacterium]
MTNAVVSLPDFSDTPANSGGFSIHDLADFANGESFKSRQPSDPEAEAAALLEAAVAQAREEERQTAFAEGLEAGKAEALNGIQNALIDELKTSLEQIDKIASDLEHDRLDYLYAVFSRLLPSLTKQGFAHEATKLLEQAALRAGETDRTTVKLSVQCSPNSVEHLQASIHGTEYADRIEMKPDPNQTDNRLSAQWSDGGFEIDIDGVAKSILKLLSSYADSEGQQETSPFVPDATDEMNTGSAEFRPETEGIEIENPTDELSTNITGVDGADLSNSAEQDMINSPSEIGIGEADGGQEAQGITEIEQATEIDIETDSTNDLEFSANETDFSFDGELPELPDSDDSGDETS